MIALITGASSGIGKAMALNFAGRGFHLILVARRKDRLMEVKEEIASFSDVRVKILQMDLSKKEDCLKLHEMVKPLHIDVLVNNAGFGLYGKFTKTDLDTELHMIDVNIKAVHILTKLFIRDFRERNYGYLLNVASIAGFMAGPMMATYYASKNYVLQLSKAIYEELRREGSNVNISVLCPGPVNTEFNQVAGVDFGDGLNPTDVAEYAISCLFRRKLIIVPDNLMKLAVSASRIAPTKTMLRMTFNVQKARRGDGETPEDGEKDNIPVENDQAREENLSENEGSDGDVSRAEGLDTEASPSPDASGDNHEVLKKDIIQDVFENAGEDELDDLEYLDGLGDDHDFFGASAGDIFKSSSLYKVDNIMEEEENEEEKQEKL